MLLLEDEHRSESNGLLARAADVDTNGLCLLENLVTAWGVPCDKSTLTLSTKVVDLARELLGELFKTSVEVGASLGGVLNEIQASDLVDDGAEEDSASWVAHPCLQIQL